MLKKIIFVLMLGVLFTLLVIPTTLVSEEAVKGGKGTVNGIDACYCGSGDNCYCVFLKPQV